MHRHICIKPRRYQTLPPLPHLSLHSLSLSLSLLYLGDCLYLHSC